MMKNPPKPSGGEDSGGDLARYNEFFKELLQPYSDLSKPIFSFIRGKLHQYDLQSHCNETEILLETYIRTTNHIAQGGKITNAAAWTKAVAFNIIRETARRKPKNQQIDPSILENLLSRRDSGDGGDCTDLTEQMVKIRDAFQLLSLKERLLIQYKVVMNKSWTTIQDSLKQEGHGDHSLAALRKQKERALNKLLNIYNSL